MLWKLESILASVLFVIAVQTTAVTFTTRMIHGSTVNDGVNDIYTWAVNTSLLTIKIQTSNFDTLSGNAFPRLILALQNGDQPIVCRLEVDTTGCTSCSSYPVTCTKEAGSTPLTIEFNTTQLTSSFNQSKLTLEELAGSVPDWIYGTKTISLEKCNTSEFPGASTTDDACGYNCEKTFNCIEGFVGQPFVRTCSAIGQWDDSTSNCTKACSNTFFNFATAILPAVVVGENGTKNFTCDECPTSHMFSRICGPGGKWKNETQPCSPVCNISDVVCSPKEDAPSFCPGNHTFSCPSGCFEDSIECLPKTGKWSTTECVCPAGLTIGQILAIVFGIIWPGGFVGVLYSLWVRNKQLIEELKKAIEELEKAAADARMEADNARAEAEKAEKAWNDAKPGPEKEKLGRIAVEARKKADAAEQKAVDAKKKVEEAKKNLESALLLSTSMVVILNVGTCSVTILCLVLLLVCLGNIALGFGGAFLILNDSGLIVCIFFIRKGSFDAEVMTLTKSPKNAN